MKRLLPLLLALALLCGCAPAPRQTDNQYTATFLTLFDTVTTMIGRAESEEAFRQKAQAIHDDLAHYHALFDIYRDYEGMANIKTINDNAGIAPVTVDPAIIDLLTDCKTYYDLTGGRVNVAMGSVLQLWHEAREQGRSDPSKAKLPAEAALLEASAHTLPDSVLIDREASTVYITDPDTRLDVGAVAKGWAVQRAAEKAPAGMLLSVGGNVCATGPKLSDGTPWVIGIQDPDVPEENLHTLYVKSGSVVTSGDYQRTYQVEGTAYHHIIDPETRMPGRYWRSVSILCEDSALADALSTGLFLMDREAGEKLAKSCHAEAFWVDMDGNEFMTDGFRAALRN